MIEVTCYGARGSLPSPSRPGFSTVGFGGNTNCFYIKAGPFEVIESCGSGVAILGDRLIGEWVAAGRPAKDYVALLSHYHWDHIQGLPFLGPIYIGTNRFHFHGFRPSGHEGQRDQRRGDRVQPQTAVEMMLAHQQSNPHFPVAHEAMPAQKFYHSHQRQFSETFWYVHHDGYPLSFWDTEPPESALRSRSGGLHPKNLLKITTIPLNHPDGCLGWRLDYLGDSVAFCYDNEPLRFPNARITTLAKGVNLIVLDGDYTEDQLRTTQQGFGHGSAESSVDQAKAAEANCCLVHHHNPKSDDAELSRAEVEARAYATEIGYTGVVDLSREGKVYRLG